LKREWLGLRIVETGSIGQIDLVEYKGSNVMVSKGGVLRGG